MYSMRLLLLIFFFNPDGIKNKYQAEKRIQLKSIYTDLIKVIHE